MMTSSRPRDVGGSFASRRGHANTLSISDPSHHVTEAIGTLYGSDDNDSDTESRENRLSRPLSFSSYSEEQLPSRPKQTDGPEDLRPTSQRSPSHNTQSTCHDGISPPGVQKSNTVPPLVPIQRTTSNEHGPNSPTLSLRDVQAAETSMPMTNIDNPSDIAQELSNLQALRRMSMDVGNSSDPDLLPFQGIVPIPPIAPSGDDDEADPSRLLWVPANVHPELAPEQFKSFLERRVNSVKRRSGDSMLSVDGPQRSNSGALRRTKSKLSRQIDHSGGHGGDGYIDGAEKLERQRSTNGYATPELSLDELVKDPAKAVQKLAQEASDGAAGPDDLPILPVAPGMGLRRSTRTQYRKSGSLRSDRGPFSKRMAAVKEVDSQEETLPPMTNAEAPLGQGRVQSDPRRAENFSRPTRSVKRQQGFTREVTSPVEPSFEEPLDDASQQQVHGRSMSDPTDVPQTVETAPSTEQPEPSIPFPERSSSQKTKAILSQEALSTAQQYREQERAEEHPPVRASKPIPPARQAVTPISLDNVPGPTQTMNDIVSPSAIPGSSGTRTDNLTFIPTFSDAEKKRRDSDSESSKSSSGWKWFKSEDKKKKEKEREAEAKRSKSTKSTDKSHDNARLDVLQNSIENVVSKGRESLLLDRDSIDNKLQEERKKESGRKSGEGKKEKDGFFGSFFGGKKKAEKELSHKKHHSRGLSPEPPPPPRVLKPDVDYHYTRFPILEERAIYRMAHIKLANPKRNLHSQVLLSNFMYSYLAKIQAMHPQMQVPVSPQQKRLEEERRRKEQEAQQQAHMEQQMQQQAAAQNSIDQYHFEYHRAGGQYGDSEGYDDDQEPYGDYDQGAGGYDAYGQQQYYDGHDPQREGENDMW